MTAPILTTPDATLAVSPDGYTAEFVEVTPDLAHDWLGNNEGNRKVKPEKVNAYLRDMNAGAWKFTGETVKFDSDGRLIDGQHRLAAIVHHGRPVYTLVVRGLQPDVQKILDRGAKRSASDALFMDGRSHASILAAASRLCLNWQWGTIKNAETTNLTEATNAEVLAFVTSDELIGWAAHHASSLKRSFPIRPSVLAFTLWLCAKKDASASVEFHRAVAELRTNGPGDPRFTLQKRLANAKSANEDTGQIAQAFYVIRAWNAWREGKTLANLKTANVHGPFGFPEPK